MWATQNPTPTFWHLVVLFTSSHQLAEAWYPEDALYMLVEWKFQLLTSALYVNQVINIFGYSMIFYGSGSLNKCFCLSLMLYEYTLYSFTMESWVHVFIFEMKKLKTACKRIARLKMVL